MAQHPVTAGPGGGCWLQIEAPDQSAIGCAREAALLLGNGLERPRRIVLETTFVSGQDLAHLQIDSALFKSSYEIRRRQHLIRETLTIPPGVHQVKLTCEAPPMSILDPQGIVFWLKNLVVKELD